MGLASLCSALALAGPAAADVQIGVVDDHAKGNSEQFFGQMNDIGLSEVRVTILWDPAAPLTITDQEAIGRMLPFAQARGIRVLFVIDLATPRAVGNSAVAAGQFAAFAAHVARTFPTVKDIIVGNEPNQTRFWQPQYNPNGTPAACVAYERLLAASYDALKQVDAGINVIGVGLSPRGNDAPRASSNVSRSPVRCLRDIGAAYRGSARRRPIMDEFSFHPYPRSDRDAALKGYQWPNAGVANLDRIKQAFWDAFNGTRQPLFAERGRSGGIKFRLDEAGWQVRVIESAAHAYEGSENVPTTEEAQQAQIYASLIRYLACDPSVRSLLFFGLFDEPILDRWQAALIRADGTRRPAYDAVKNTFAQTGGRCTGKTRSWSHSRHRRRSAGHLPPRPPRAREAALVVVHRPRRRDGPVLGRHLPGQGPERRSIARASPARSCGRAASCGGPGPRRPTGPPARSSAAARFAPAGTSTASSWSPRRTGSGRRRSSGARSGSASRSSPHWLVRRRSNPPVGAESTANRHAERAAQGGFVGEKKAAGRRGSSEDDLPLQLNRAPDLGDGRGLNPSPDEHRPAASTEVLRTLPREN